MQVVPFESCWQPACPVDWVIVTPTVGTPLGKVTEVLKVPDS